MENYWQKEYKDICDGVIFKIKEINPIDMLNLVMANIDPQTRQLKNQKEFLGECMRQFVWTKDGMQWFPLVDEEGRARLPELDKFPSITLDLMFVFRKDVLMPVCTESNTFQSPSKVGTKKNSK